MRFHELMMKIGIAKNSNRERCTEHALDVLTLSSRVTSCARAPVHPTAPAPAQTVCASVPAQLSAAPDSSSSAPLGVQAAEQKSRHRLQTYLIQNFSL